MFTSNMKSSKVINLVALVLTNEPFYTNGLLNELGLFIANTTLESSIFRSDHASNYLVLKGILGKDKELLLQKISEAVHNPDKTSLREEWQRGL